MKPTHAPSAAPKPERPNATKTITSLSAEVEAATAALAESKAKSQKANSEECAARNRVNKAQRELDAAVEQLRKGAPFDSDWSRTRA